MHMNGVRSLKVIANCLLIHFASITTNHHGVTSRSKQPQWYVYCNYHIKDTNCDALHVVRLVGIMPQIILGIWYSEIIQE